MSPEYKGPPPLAVELVSGPALQGGTPLALDNCGLMVPPTDEQVENPLLREPFNPAAHLTLPTNSEARKLVPLVGGCDNYFAAALCGVAAHSYRSNEKHNPGEEMHWSRDKSNDHAECIRRHMKDIQDMLAAQRRGHGPATEEILKECDALAWRALAFSQEMYELIGGAPLSPASRRAE